MSASFTPGKLDGDGGGGRAIVNPFGGDVKVSPVDVDNGGHVVVNPMADDYHVEVIDIPPEKKNADAPGSSARAVRGRTQSLKVATF